MATAQSLTSRKSLRGRREAYCADLALNQLKECLASDPARIKLAKTALEAPVLRNDLDPLSYAWKLAVVMISCYGTIPAADEGSYKRTYGAETLEEVAEGMMIDGGWTEGRSKRTYDLAAKSALHALNWARNR